MVVKIIKQLGLAINLIHHILRTRQPTQDTSHTSHQILRKDQSRVRNWDTNLDQQMPSPLRNLIVHFCKCQIVRLIRTDDILGTFRTGVKDEHGCRRSKAGEDVFSDTRREESMVGDEGGGCVLLEEEVESAGDVADGCEDGGFHRRVGVRSVSIDRAILS